MKKLVNQLVSVLRDRKQGPVECIRYRIQMTDGVHLGVYGPEHEYFVETF